MQRHDVVVISVQVEQVHVIRELRHEISSNILYVLRLGHPDSLGVVTAVLQGICVGVELLRQRAHQAPVSGFIAGSVSGPGLNEVLFEPFTYHFPRDGLGVPQVEVAETSNVE